MKKIWLSNILRSFGMIFIKLSRKLIYETYEEKEIIVNDNPPINPFEPKLGFTWLCSVDDLLKDYLFKDVFFSVMGQNSIETFHVTFVDVHGNNLYDKLVKEIRNPILRTLKIQKLNRDGKITETIERIVKITGVQHVGLDYNKEELVTLKIRMEAEKQ